MGRIIIDLIFQQEKIQMRRYYHLDTLHQQSYIRSQKRPHFKHHSKQNQTSPEAFEIFLQKNYSIQHSSQTIGWRQTLLASHLGLLIKNQGFFRKDHKGKKTGQLFQGKLKQSDLVKIPFNISEIFQKDFAAETSKIYFFNDLEFTKVHSKLIRLILEDGNKYLEDKHKFQGIGLLLLQYITGKNDFLLITEQPRKKSTSMEQTQQMAEYLGNRYDQYIKRADIKERINSASQKHGVNYLRILDRIFKDDSRYLTWKEIIFLLVQKNCESSEDSPDLQHLIVCENQQTTKLLRKAEILKWDEDKKLYFLARPLLYFTLLKRLYNNREKTFDGMLRHLIKDMRYQAYQQAIQQLEEENLIDNHHYGKGNDISDSEDQKEPQVYYECNKEIQSRKFQQGELFLYNYFDAETIVLLSQKPQSLIYQIDKEQWSFVVKLFPSQQQIDIQLFDSIFSQRESFKNSNNLTMICGSFKHQDRFVLISPIYQIQRIIKQVHFRQSVDKGRILQLFFQKVFAGDRCFLYTLDNIWFESNQISFNVSSVVGLLPLNNKSDFQKQVLEQVYELLDIDLFASTQDRLRLIGQKQKFKAIGMFLLYLIQGQKVSLLNQNDLKGEKKLSFKKTKKIVRQIPERFRSYLSKSGNTERIKHAERKNGAKYLLYLRFVFEYNCMKMDWKYAVSLLFRQDSSNGQKSRKKIVI